MRWVLRDQLDALDFHIRVATDGSLHLVALAEELPEVLVVDFAMPV
jgi:CheY-like chemotaxis protein